MKFTSTIAAYGNADRIKKAFAAEKDSALASDRGSYTLEEHSDHVLFTITAEDATVHRAIMNSLTKLLTVFEKTEEL